MKIERGDPDFSHQDPSGRWTARVPLRGRVTPFWMERFHAHTNNARAATYKISQLNAETLVFTANENNVPNALAIIDEAIGATNKDHEQQEATDRARHDELSRQEATKRKEAERMNEKFRRRNSS